MTGNLRRDQGGSPPQTDEVEEKLLSAAINADVILEPAQTDPRPILGFPGAPEPEAPPAPVIVPVADAGLPQPPVKRPFARGDGLRLMPLAGFIWGGQTHARPGANPAPAAPRVRGDHVILLVTKGGTALEFPRHNQLLDQGRIAFIPAGTAFSLHPPREVEGWALLLPPNLGLGLPIGFPLVFHQGLPHPNDAGLLEPAFRALGHDHAFDPRDSSVTALHLGLLAMALSRAVDRPQIHDTDQLHSLVARPLTDNFLALAGHHLADGRTIADMARELGCTQAQLDKACHESRGKSALDLVYGLRLDRAASLLRDSDMSVTAIAQEVGYTGVGHLMRVFAAATGRTPEAFRWMSRNQSPGGD